MDIEQRTICIDSAGEAEIVLCHREVARRAGGTLINLANDEFYLEEGGRVIEVATGQVVSTGDGTGNWQFPDGTEVRS